MSKYSIERTVVHEIQTSWITNTREKLLVSDAITSEYYLRAYDYRSQCHDLHYLLHPHGFSNRKIAKLLGVDHKSFEKQLSLPLESRPNSRPIFLTKEEKVSLFEIINGYLEKGIKPTLYDALQLTIENFHKSLSPDTLRTYIMESGYYRIIKGDPIDENRYNVSDENMENYFIELKKAVDGVPASLVYNMDEAGQDEYVDEYSMKVIVKSDYQGEVTNIPVRRESKRATLIHYICNDGTYTKPLLIIPRKTVDSLILKRLTFSNLYIKHQTKDFANTNLIRNWLETIFFPEISRKIYHLFGLFYAFFVKNGTFLKK